MTRIHHARPHARPQPGPSRAGILDQSRAAPRKKKPYKIVLEAVTQEKKKLHSILTYGDHAPSGFGFIPAGHPDFTEWCKEQCRQRNLDVHIVSAKPKNKMHTDPEKLSHHVHRLGHHFPLNVITLACSKFGYVYDDKRSLRKERACDRDNWIARQVENYSSRQLPPGGVMTEKETKNHTRGAVREMFPKIPEADLSAIISHAFEEGTNRVGNATELPLSRRVQLAVVAHIRHTYTDYDKILKTGSWIEARQKVEHVSLAKLKEWRDESDEQSNEIEDTFREVIILDDDDDEDPSNNDSGSTPDEREQSMEIVSSRVAAQDIRPNQQHPHYSRTNAYNALWPSRKTIFVHSSPLPPAAAPPASSYPEPGLRPAYARTQPVHTIQDSRAPFSDLRVRPAMPQPDSRTPNIMRDSDGRLYELQPVEEPRGSSRTEYNHPRPAPRYSYEGFVQPSPRAIPFDAYNSRLPPPPPAPLQPLPPPPPPISRRVSDQDTVIPSVEREMVDSVSSRRPADARPPAPQHSSAPRQYVDMHSPKRTAFSSFVDIRDSHSEKFSKHPGQAHHEPPPQADARRPAMNYHSTDPRNTPRREVIDLTSSEQRPPVVRDRVQHYPTYTAAAPNSYPHVHAPPHRSPPREVRSGYYEGHGRGAYPSYQPDDRMYPGRPPPPYDVMHMRDERSHHRVDGARVRYLHSGANHGGHGSH